MKKQEILDAFNFRHACKQFDPEKKISDEDFNVILESARLSPSSFGFEPWHFVVVQDMKKRELFSKSFWGGNGKWQTASHLVFALSRKQKDVKVGSQYLAHIMKDIEHLPEEYSTQLTNAIKKFQDVDFGLTKYPQGLDDWATHQVYIPLANMMTTAALLGIDSCPMEGFDKAEMNRILESEFGFDQNEFSLAYVVAFGSRVEDPRPKTRQKIEDIVTWVK